MAINPVRFQPVKFVKSLVRANKPFEAKPRKTMVNIPDSFENDIYNNIASQYNRMDYVANLFQKPFTFAEKGNSVLVNFGTRTSVFKNTATKSEIEDVIDNLIKQAFILRK